MGSVTQFRRSWPGLVRQVQSERHMRFRKSPVLKLSRGKPRNETWWRNGEVTRSRVTLPKRIIRDYPEKYGKVAAKHELRENLALQNNWSRARAHRMATRKTKSDMRRLSHRRKTGDYYRLPFAVPPHIIRFATRPPTLGYLLSLS